MLILASNSATRAQILNENGISFVQKNIDFNEKQIKVSLPKEYVYSVTKGKYEHFLSTHGDKDPFVCADTIVVCKEEILQKAKDKNEAKKMLLKQSGSKVKIITCMIYHSKNLHLEDLSVTTYQFKPFDMNRLEEYLNSNKWEGKAGACMVEDFCKEYILTTNGLKSTARGLSVEKLIPFLGNL